MRTTTRPSRHQRERGLALIGVVGLLLVFLVFAGAMITQLANELNSTKMATVSNRALAGADAGVHAMVEQIQTDLDLRQPLPSGPIVYFYPEPGASPVAESYSATVAGPYPAQGVNYYLITSIGTYDNGRENISRRVRAIARGVPISDYASFSNYEVNQYGNPVWYLSSQHFNGPVYSGGPMRIAYASPSPTVTPIFGASVQTGNVPVWSPCDPTTCGGWSSVSAGGSSSFSVNSTALSLPQPQDNISVASYAYEGDGLMTSYPAVPAGVYIDGSTSGGKDAASTTSPIDTTGIYINVGSSGTATITSTVSGNTDTLKIYGPWAGDYQVTINYSGFNSSGDCSGATTVTHGVATHTFSGTPCGAPGPGVTNPGNGAIFSNGNIQLGRGGQPDTTLEGDYSFVTPDYSGYANDITLLGNLFYDPGSATYDKTALWANDVILASNTSTGLTVDSAIIAGYPGESWSSGYFKNNRCNKTGCGSGSQGILNINGSLVENARGAVGEVIGGIQYGFARVINFDSRFATAPPPFNPTTGALQIIAWEDMGQ